MFYSHCTKCLFLAGCDVLLEAGARETWENPASCAGFSHLAACSQPAGCVTRERSLPAWLSGHLGPQRRLSWRKPKAACPFLRGSCEQSVQRPFSGSSRELLQVVSRRLLESLPGDADYCRLPFYASAWISGTEPSSGKK